MGLELGLEAGVQGGGKCPTSKHTLATFAPHGSRFSDRETRRQRAKPGDTK